MTERSTLDAPTSKASRGVMGLSTVFVASAVGVTYFGAKVLAGPVNPAYRDHLWRPWAFLVENETVLRAVFVAVFVVSGATLVVARRTGRMPAPLLAQVVVWTLFAAWLGTTYQGVTAPVSGVNIGGVMGLFLTPVIAVGCIIVVAGLARRSMGRGDRPA